ncbi:MAG: cytochrome b/b6 domain-containing protein [Paracoccaceae bacterium]
MRWRNDATHFGLITRLIHWAMALLIILMLILGTILHAMQPSLANLWLYGLHKTGGLVALTLLIVRLIWHRISPPPAPLGPPNAWSNRAAKVVHGLIYLLVLCIPLSGWIASSATGIDVMFADRWVIPPIAPVSEVWEHWGFLVHGVLTKVLMGVLALHVLGALKRGIDHDGTMRRMIGG